MRIERPRLLIGSLAVAVAVSLIGGIALARYVGDDDADTDAVLSDPTDRDITGDDFSIETLPDLSGDRLPDVEVADVDGQPVRTSSFIGQPLVINFWFSTCAPCAKELGDFAEVDAEVGDEVRFLGMNSSLSDTVPVMVRFAAERGVTYELYKDDLVELQTALDIAFFPVTIFVASDGTIVEQTGVLDADGLRDKVANLLEVDA